MGYPTGGLGAAIRLPLWLVDTSPRCHVSTTKSCLEFKAGYRACLIQTGHKLTWNLILDTDLVWKSDILAGSCSWALLLVLNMWGPCGFVNEPPSRKTDRAKKTVLHAGAAAQRPSLFESLVDSSLLHCQGRAVAWSWCLADYSLVSIVVASGARAPLPRQSTSA